MTIDVDPTAGMLDVPLNEYRASMGEYLNSVASDAWANGPLSQIARMATATSAQQRALEKGDSLLTVEQANQESREGGLGLTFGEPIARGAFDVIAGERRRQIADESVFKRARLEHGYGTLSWLLAGGTEFLVQAADPLNAITSFLPVVGEARYAIMAAKMGAVGASLSKAAIEGLVGQALLEPLNVAEKNMMGEDYTLLDTVTNLAFGAGLGVILHGAAYGAGAGFRFIRERYIIGEPSAPAPPGGTPSPTAPAPLSPHVRAPETSPVVAREETPPPRQPVAEQMETLNQATKETAMRVAVAQLVNDKPVDIGPALASDPAWPQVETNILDMQAHLERQRQAAAEVAPVPFQVPASFTPSPEQAQMASRLVRGWTPEKPLPAPLSLSEWVRERGGLREGTPEAGDLRASVEGEGAKGLVSEKGGDVERLAQAAHEEGYIVPRNERVGSGVDIDGFVRALIADASGQRKSYPDDIATTHWQAQQEFFNELAQSLSDLGIEPRGMDSRRLAYILSQDPSTQRLLALLDRVDRLGDHASLELLDRLDREMGDLQRTILAEPGSIERDGIVDHREFPPATLDQIEQYYRGFTEAEHATPEAKHGDEPRTPGEDQGRRQPTEPGPAGGRPSESGQAQADRPTADEPPPEAPGLRQPEGPQGATAPDQGTTANLGEWAERQRQSDLVADPAELNERDVRLAEADKEVAERLEQDLKTYDSILTDEDRRMLKDIESTTAEETKALDAMATCELSRGPS